MKKKEDIRTYSVEQIKAMRARGEDLTDWKKVDSIAEQELERLIATDADEAGIEWNWENAKIGFPKPKQMVNLRLDHDLLSWFRAQGKGYQTKINAILRSYMEHEKA